MKKYKCLDIWAIQFYPKELYTALSQIKEDADDVLIMGNVRSSFKIDGAKYPLFFDTVVYSEKSDVIILLMERGEATREQVEEYLYSKKIGYDEVVFSEKRKFRVKTNKVFWFARDSYVVADASEDSKNRGNTTCTYQPTNASLKLNYRGAKSAFPIEEIEFAEIIDFEDKFILVTKSKNQQQKHDEIIDILNEKGIEIIEKTSENTI